MNLFGVRDTGPLEKQSDLGDSGSPFEVGWFDFWLLFGAGFVALLGTYLSIFGLRMGPDRTRVFINFAASPLYAGLTAAVAATVPRKVGFPVLPIFESWHARSLTLQEVIFPVVVALAVGTLASCAAFYYEHALITLIGPSASAITPRYPPTGPLAFVCTAILEEILFRAIFFPIFAIVIKWICGPLTSRGTPTIIWIANVLQALLFGAGHIAIGRGILKAQPWYIRLPLVSQTWSGLIEGCIYYWDMRNRIGDCMPRCVRSCRSGSYKGHHSHATALTELERKSQ